jgi:hypothetical protein
LKKGILQFLEGNRSINSFEIIDFRQFDTGFYLKLVVEFVNGTTLHAKEYFDVLERNYSFHWQNKKGSMILRWDNAPHHPNIITYPHHKHTKSGIAPSREITLEQVIMFIEKEITKR